MHLCVLAFLAALCSVSLAGRRDGHSPKPVNDDAVIAHINTKTKTTWKAGRTEFSGRSHLEKASFAGHVFPKTSPPRSHDLCSSSGTSTKTTRQAVSSATLPASFDAREAWPDCSSIIGDVRNQGQCGSCWAFASSSVFADRLCISRGLKVKISAQDLVSCMPNEYRDKDDRSQDACATGGDALTMANRMFVFKGAVTGGDFGSNSGCYVYDGQAYRNAKASTCAEECTNSDYSTDYESDKIKAVNAIFMGHEAAKFWRLSVNDTYFYTKQGVITRSAEPSGDLESLIKNEIMTYGPVTAVFDILNDLYNYNGIGVYQKTDAPDNKNFGGHVVKIIGWGNTFDGVPYWLGVNSWGTKWGDKGLFRFLRGSNHLGIENFIVGTRLQEITASDE